MQKVEGNVVFYTARSTAFPQGVPGVAKGPGPMPVPTGELKNFLGPAKVSLVPVKSPRAIVDTPLAG
jgi:Icc protein